MLKKILIALVVLMAVVGAAFLVPAVQQTANWQWARIKDNPECYQAYLKAWPDASNSQIARQRLESLLWQGAQKADKPGPYRNYLSVLPNGRHAPQARAMVSLAGGCEKAAKSKKFPQNPKWLELAKLAGTGQDLLFLGKLQQAHKEDAKFLDREWPWIEHLFGVFLAQGRFKYKEENLEKWTESASDFLSATSETIQKKNSAYYMALNAELIYMFVDVQKDRTLFLYRRQVAKLKKKLLAGSADFTAAMGSLSKLSDTAQSGVARLRALKTSMEAGFLDMLLAMSKAQKPVESCARRHLWQTMGRLVAGGPYYSQVGIESLAKWVEELKQARGLEKNFLVRETADQVLAAIAAKAPKPKPAAAAKKAAPGKVK